MFISYESVLRWIREIPEHFKTQKMCNETVAQFPYTLRYVPDHLKTQKTCNQAVRNNPAVFFLVPDFFFFLFLLNFYFLFLIIVQHSLTQNKYNNKYILKKTNVINTKQELKISIIIKNGTLFLIVLKHKNCVSRPLK